MIGKTAGSAPPTAPDADRSAAVPSGPKDNVRSAPNLRLQQPATPAVLESGRLRAQSVAAAEPTRLGVNDAPGGTHLFSGDDTWIRKDRHGSASLHGVTPKRGVARTQRASPNSSHQEARSLSMAALRRLAASRLLIGDESSTTMRHANPFCLSATVLPPCVRSPIPRCGRSCDQR